ncbi:hypothetical protein MHM39_14840 [Phaeobacter sp. CNT1-3]|nr:hypothetical protein [Phaeobacter sp. CNT1-3]
MVDFPVLMMKADTRGMVGGEEALDRIGTAAERAEAKTDSMTAGTKRASAGVEKLGASSKRSGAEMAIMATAAKNANTAFANSHGIRMAALQLGQVTQQVASGTSAMRALSIQMPDLLIGFGTFGAIAGVVAGALGPLAVGLFQSADGAGTFEKNLDTLTASVSDYIRLAKQAGDIRSGFDASEQLELTSVAFRDLVAISKIEAHQNIDALNRSLVAAVVSASTLKTQMGDTGDLLGIETVLRGNITVWKANRAEVRSFIGELNALRAAKTLDEKYQAAIQLRETFKATVDVTGEMTDAQLSFWKSLSQSVQQMELLGAAAKEVQKQSAYDEAHKKMLGHYVSTRVEGERLASVAGEAVAAFEAQARLANAIASFGANSAQVEDLKRQNAAKSAEAFILQEGLTGALAENVRQSAMAAFDAEVNTRNAATALRESEAAAKGLASAMAAAAGFSLNLDQNVSVLEAEIAALQNGADVAIASQITKRRLRAEGVRDAQVAAGVDRAIADAQLAIDMSQIDRQETLLQQKKRLTDAARERGKAAKSASTSAMASLLGEISYREKLLDLTGDQRRQYAAVHTVIKRLGKDAAKYSQSQINGLASQLVALEDQEAALERVAALQGQWADQITRGIFQGENLGDTIKNMLREIAMQFARARIVLPVVASVTGGIGLSSLVSGTSGGTSGGAAGLLGSTGNIASLGGMASGIWSGLGGVLSGGGLGSSFANLGGLLSGSVGGLGAIGAALPAIGLVVAGFSLLFGKTKELDRGIRVTVDGFDSLVETFQKTETSRLFGLSKKRRTRYSTADASLADPIMATVAQLQDSVVTTAGALGFGVNAFEDFGTRVRISTKGLSEEEAAAEIQKQLKKVADGMASIVLEGHGVVKAGESASDALSRLSSALTVTNDVMDLLGHQLFTVGVIGADAASQLTDAFGGSEAMANAAQAYFAGFYSDAEQRAATLRRLTAQFTDLDQAMPQSRAEFRALIEGIDLTTEAGRSLYAALLPLSGALDQVLPQVDAMTLAMQDQVDQLQASIADQTSGIQAAMSSAQETARLWTRVSDTARGFLGDMISGPLSTASRTQATALSARRFAGALDLGLSGDVTAAQDATGYARSYLENALASASSGAEYARIAGQVMAQISGLADVADLTGDASADMAALYAQQIDVLTGLGDYLRTSDDNLAAFTAAVAGYQSDLAGLSGSIASLAAAAGASAQVIAAGQGGSDLSGQLTAITGVPAPVLPQANSQRSAPVPDPTGSQDQRALIRELQALRAENRQLLMAINQNQRATVKGLKIIHLDNAEAQNS